MQLIIFLKTIHSLSLSHFLLKNCSLHFLVSEHVNNICIGYKKVIKFNKYKDLSS
jgi:hypothetical protein